MIMQKARIAILIIALAFMVVVVYDQWDKLQSFNWVIRKDYLAASIVGIVGLLFLDALGWHLILRAMGQQISAEQSIRIWQISSLARYIPGGIWSYASRVTLAKGAGVNFTYASMSLYLETLLLMASSLAVGLPALFATTGLPFSPLSSVALCLSLGLMMHPKIISLLRYLPGKTGDGISRMTLPSVKCTLGLYGYYLVFWILFGVVFDCYVAAFFPLPLQSWIPAGASIALGFFIGFVLIFIPGGLGVRESALYVLLLPFLPAPVSLLISVSSRLWIILGELLSLGIILIYGKLVKLDPLKNLITK